MKIAVDAMGGDYAPHEIIKGVIAAVDEYNVEIILVGNEQQIKKELNKYTIKEDKITIVDASDVVEMGEAPVTAIRKKPNSSIMVATDLVKNKKAEAIISAGNTGAAMAAAKLRLRSIKGIERPAIAAVLPTETGHTLLLDVGVVTTASSPGKL